MYSLPRALVDPVSQTQCHTHIHKCYAHNTVTVTFKHRTQHTHYQGLSQRAIPLGVLFLGIQIHGKWETALRDQGPGARVLFPRVLADGHGHCDRWVDSQRWEGLLASLGSRGPGEGVLAFALRFALALLCFGCRWCSSDLMIHRLLQGAEHFSTFFDWWYSAFEGFALYGCL